MTKNKRKHDEKKSGIKAKNDVNEELKTPFYFSYVFGILLLGIFALSLYLRIVMPYDSVFRNSMVAFASDDAVFQMRLVENTLYNFPHRIVYDAFTIYPYGSPIHWGPLWTQIIASVSLIVGMGSYNMQTVNTIGAIMPSVFGALVVFPVYFIGKSLGNRSIGLLAAFMIAILPGQFFSRSTLGFTDNHVAEVLFSTATVALFILAIKSGRERNIKFSEISLKDKTVLFSLFAGVMLAGYQLSWPGAPFFGLIISIFVLIQYIIDDMRGRSTDYIAIAAVPMFLIDLISVLPYFRPEFGFSTTSYSWFHIAVPIAGMGLPIALSLVSAEMKKRGYSPYYYPLILGGLFALGMLGVMIFIPQLYDTLVGAPRIVFEVKTGGASTIAEVSPISERQGMLWSNFPITGFLQKDDAVLWFIIAVLIFIGYMIARKQRPQDMLFLVWTTVMLLAMYGQNRWAYYFAVNAALVVGYAGAGISESILKFGGWELPADKISVKNFGFTHILSSILVVMLLLFFAYQSLIVTAIGSDDQSPISRWGGGDPSGGGYGEWLDALNWMRYYTPDPGIDYYAIYEKSKNSTYPYPETAYGVMSWWDYGHVITYWARRIPNANPFQSGIGGGTSHLPGASTFLTAKSEEEANKILDTLGINGKPGARYIVSNAYMAYDIMQVFGIWTEDYDYFTQIQTNKGPQVIPSEKYYENMESRLHIFDGNGLKQYRLVHESPLNRYSDEQFYKRVYDVLYGGNIPVETSGLVKVFEYVKGAKITGNAPPDTTVTLMNTIKTNIGRTIQYSQTTSSNGTYVFTVPYSTLGPISGIFECNGCFFTGKNGGTQFDTKPVGAYTVAAGNVSKQVDVSEIDVLEGNVVTLNLV